jgi:hypothetical protein
MWTRISRFGRSSPAASAPSSAAVESQQPGAAATAERAGGAGGAPLSPPAGFRLSDDPEWRQLLETVNALAEHVAHLDKNVNSVGHMKEMLSALVRRAYLGGATLPPPHDLTSQRFRYYSQNGEDGILLELYRRAGSTNQRSVEIGCGMNGGNSGFLVRECGWQGLMVDGNPKAIAKVKIRYGGSDVTIVHQLVSRENVNALLQAHGFDGPVDLLSIDVDGMDYWIWEAINCCFPRIVVMEYNWLFGPDRAVTVPYRADFSLAASKYRGFRGASLKALTYLARRKGYRLVATEQVNAFFLRHDVGPDIPECDPVRFYRPAPTQGMDVYRRIDLAGLQLVEIAP